MNRPSPDERIHKAMTEKKINSRDEESSRHSIRLRDGDAGRVSRCPMCSGTTASRQFSLLIAVKGSEPILLGNRCRYCRTCNLIIADEAKLVALLASVLEEMDPAALGNEYFVLPAANLSSLPEDILQPPTCTETFERLAKLQPHSGVEHRPAGWYSGPMEK